MGDDNLTPRQDEAVAMIMRIMIDLPWQERERVFAAVRYNDVFCPQCGQGSESNPNPDCQCWNDE